MEHIPLSYHSCGSHDKSDYGAKCLCQCVPSFVGHRVQGRQGQEVAKQRVNWRTCGKWSLNENFIVDLNSLSHMQYTVLLERLLSIDNNLCHLKPSWNSFIIFLRLLDMEVDSG